MNSNHIETLTFSPALEDGPTQSDLPGSQTVFQSGLGQRHASPSLMPDNGEGKATNVTCGQSSTVSSASAVLQSSLGSRLQQRFAGAGWMLYSETWKQKATPSGLPYWEHTASKLRTRDNGSTGGLCGWMSPTVSSANTGVDPHKQKQEGVSIRFQDQVLYSDWRTPGLENANRGGDDPNRRLQQGHQLNLQDQVRWADWPTATSRDHFPAHAEAYVAAKKAQGHGMANLSDRVQLADWPTAAARDFRSEAATEEFNHQRWTHSRGKPLNATVEHMLETAPWATPDAQKADSNGLCDRPSRALTNRQTGYLAEEAVEFIPLGPQYAGSPVLTENSARPQLNPHFTRWLMGYPVQWCEVAIRMHRRTHSTPRKRGKRESEGTVTP